MSHAVSLPHFSFQFFVCAGGEGPGTEAKNACNSVSEEPVEEACFSRTVYTEVS